MCSMIKPNIGMRDEKWKSGEFFSDKASKYHKTVVAIKARILKIAEALALNGLIAVCK